MSRHILSANQADDAALPIECEFDLASYTVTVTYQPQAYEWRHVINIVPVNVWPKSTLPSSFTLHLERQQENCTTCLDYPRFSLHAEIADYWPRFLTTHLQLFIDLSLSRLLFEDKDPEDLLWIAPSAPGRVWCFYLTAGDHRAWRAHLIERARPETIDMTYTLMNTGEQKYCIEDLYQQFMDWLGEEWFSNPAARTNRMLTVKVNPGELWFLRFPLSVFSQLRHGEWGAYKAVEWIVTNRGFVQYGRERAQMHMEVTEAARLLADSVVVINTYHEHGDNALCQQGTRLCLELLGLLQQVEFPSGPVSLRWYLNPTAEVLSRLLADRQTVYFFADFEASSGVWELGDGPRLAWSDPCETAAINITALAAPTASPRQTFPLQYDAFTLAHIRLMRVFHCNSVFDPFRASFEPREPSDHHSLVRRLLEAGVQRVEGGMTEESFLDYQCALIELLSQSPQFNFLLRFKCLEAGLDPAQLMTRLDNFRAACQSRRS